MAVARKWKRKITVNERLFWWYIKEWEDRCGLPHLFVLSPDKHFMVAYQLSQIELFRFSSNENLTPFVIVMGKEFGALPEAGCWRRVRLPGLDWDDVNIAPAFVRKFIEWCLDENKEAVQVDDFGRRI